MITSFRCKDTQELAITRRNKRWAAIAAGQHSIRINDQWRICFVWNGGNADAVEITDYH